MSGPPHWKSPVTSPADELSEALQMFVHELRTPVSAALGYLRLLQDDRVSDPDTRSLAITRSIEGLGRIGRLCAEAAAFAEAEALEARRYPIADLVTAIRAVCEREGLGVDVTAGAAQGSVRTIAPPEAAEAVITVLRSGRRRAEPVAALHIGAGDGALIAANGDMEAVRGWSAPAAAIPFDPWRHSRGFPPALAARRLAEGGARIVTDAEGRTIAVMFAQETEA